MKYEIGQFYRVPCLKASDTPPNFAKAGSWIPVLLPEHDDKEIIGFLIRHYHLDFRFLSDWAYRRANVGSILHEFGRVDTHNFYERPVLYQRMKCKRKMPNDYPEYAPWLPKLESKYADACLIDGKCPHKGIDLSGCPSVNGVVVCPAHGLLWEVETGKMVPRPREALWAGLENDF